MISLKHDSDNGWFDVYENETYIGHIWCGVDNKWFFEADRNGISDLTLSDVRSILSTLNL